MARLNIEDEYWGDNRRAQLAIKLGCQFKADGVMTNAWKLAQKFWSLDKKLIPKKHWIEAGMPDAVFEVKFADDRGDYVYVRGTEEKFSWYVERQEAAKKGGAASANKRWPSKRQAKVDQTVTKSNQSLSKSKQSVTKRKQTQPSSSFSSSSSTSTSFSNSASSNLAPGVSDETAPPPELPISLELVEEPKTKATWCSYKEAYRTKYGEEPVWNAKVGGQLSQFVDRLGREESPQVAAFYLTHRDFQYEKNCHGVGLMLSHAEKLRTEWATGRKVNSVSARANERMDNNVSALQEYWQEKHGSGA